MEKFKDSEYVKNILHTDEFAEKNWYNNLLEKGQGFLNQKRHGMTLMMTVNG